MKKTIDKHMISAIFASAGSAAEAIAAGTGTGADVAVVATSWWAGFEQPTSTATIRIVGTGVRMFVCSVFVALIHTGLNTKNAG